MANPQKENGHAPLANESLEALYKQQLNDSAWRVLLWVFRNSYGWSNPETVKPILPKPIAEATGMPLDTVDKALRLLRERNILASGGYQKDYDAWHSAKNGGAIDSAKNGGAFRQKWRSLLIVKQKAISSGENSQKRQGGEEVKAWFETIWKLYPRKVGRHGALKSCLRINPPTPLRAQIAAALSRHVASWSDREPQYIPHLSTWLNQKRWEDHIDEQTPLPPTGRRFI